MYAIRSYYAAILQSMLRAAERTGNLAEALERYGNYRRQLGELRDKLWAAATSYNFV